MTATIYTFLHKQNLENNLEKRKTKRTLFFALLSFFSCTFVQTHAEIIPLVRDMSSSTVLSRDGESSGEIYAPVDLATDSQDNIFVAEFRSQNNYTAPKTIVKKFTKNGVFLTSFGLPNSPAVSNFSAASSIRLAIDVADNIYVYESGGNCRVQKFSNTGVSLTANLVQVILMVLL